MSGSFLAGVEGYTPVIDVLAEELGLIPAAVYGFVVRYCQLRDGVCYTSLQTIADRVGLSRRTVIRHIKELCKTGYLEDLTPDRGHRPHSYRDSGQHKIAALVVARRGVTESHTCEPSGVTESHSRGDIESPVGVTESHSRILPIDTIEETAPPPVAPHRAYFSVLAKICQLDSKITSNAGRMNRVAKELRLADVTIDEIQLFYQGDNSWWWSQDWRGAKGEPPQPETIGKTIGIARTWASHNGKPRDGPLETFWGEDNNGNRVELTR